MARILLLLAICSFTDLSAWSPFDNLRAARPPEPMDKLHRYQDDPSIGKINLVIGVYRTNEDQSWVLPVVRKAQNELANETFDHDYMPILGYEPFVKASAELVLGVNSTALLEKRVMTVQSLSGTGALRAGAEFLHHVLGLNTYAVSKPSWLNHQLIFNRSGFTNLYKYAYWDAGKRQLNFEQMMNDLEMAPERSVVVLHACAHNPTGIDPNHKQWWRLAELIKRRGLFPFFDLAYQGYASGDLDLDAWAIRHFVDQGIELAVAQSYSKSFGLYDERVGNLIIVINDPGKIQMARANMMHIIRPLWLNPPSHGARIVAKILTSPALREEWVRDIQTMSGRIRKMRIALRRRVKLLLTPGNWSHITNQIGMFCYTGLSPRQVEYMVNAKKVYMLSDGRINIAGLTTHNVDKVARAIHDAVMITP